MPHPIFVAGHRGLVGSAIVRALRTPGYDYNLITRTRSELDLTDGAAVSAFFDAYKPAYVFLGGSEGRRNSPIILIRPILFAERPSHPMQCSQLCLPQRGEEVAVPWFRIHLPQNGAAADQRRVSADGRFRVPTNEAYALADSTA